ncbi:MAG: hypothetical protein EBT83_09800 [Betaproteobacteria bacterium]|nr:hypothetical protein [Betaproteobacteria bacterium]
MCARHAGRNHRRQRAGQRGQDTRRLRRRTRRPRRQHAARLRHAGAGFVGRSGQRQPRPHARLRRCRRRGPCQHRHRPGRAGAGRKIVTRRQSRQRTHAAHRHRCRHRYTYPAESGDTNPRLDHRRGLVPDADVRLSVRRGNRSARARPEGRYGVFRAYVRDAAPDWNALLGGLGHEFPLLAKHGFKVWPACGYTRATNTAVLELRNEHKLKPDDVETITVIGGTGGAQLLSEPLEAKRRPKLSIDGKFSIPFTTAVMMTHGNVQLRDYTDAALRDPAVLAMADRVSWRADPGAAVPVGGESALSRPTVEIRLRDGRVLSRKADGVPGDPRHPIAQAQLEAKFRDCVSFAARPLAGQNIDRAVAMINALESLDDAADIVRALN